MAFRTPPPEAIAYAERELPLGIEQLTRRHDVAVSALLEAAEAANGTVDPAVTLAAIKEYRAQFKTDDGRDTKFGIRVTMHRLAQHLIAAGVAPGRVCKQLGYGRTAMNKAMSSDDAFKRLIEPGKKSMKKEVA